MKTFILFREGLSGHYLKSILTGEKTSGKFRMDPWWPGIYDVDRNKHNNIKDSSPMQCGHNLPDEQFDLTLVILVNRKIYQAIYNNFYKKMLIEEFESNYNQWQNNLLFWYDKIYYNIKQYYDLYQQDRVANQILDIVDFDQLLDVEYLDHISTKYFNCSLSDHSRTLAQEYASHQLNIDLTLDGNSMEEILDPIPDSKFQESPWFSAYAIFKFEKNNGLDESQRQWSIDNISQPMDRKFLIDISQKYN
jgi:hypothetical protein